MQYFIQTHFIQTHNLKIIKIYILGGTAGCLNWGLGIMPDVLKSRFQTGSYNSIREVFADVMAKEGIRGMYRGFVPVMLRAFPANACAFLGYEGTMQFLNYISPQLQQTHKLLLISNSFICPQQLHISLKTFFYEEFFLNFSVQIQKHKST